VSKESQRLPSLNARIKTRRAQLGLTGAQLAEQAGISASYVSLIESGAKVPDEDVAARLADALGDDEGLYRGWARAARLGLDKLGLVNQLEAIAQTPAYLDLVESGHSLPRLDSGAVTRRQQSDAETLRARLREVASKLTTVAAPAPTRKPDLRQAAEIEAAPLRVPLLVDGVDPIVLEGPSPPSKIRDEILLDARLFGPPAGLVFAYEVTESSLGHLRGLAQPGDLVVLRQGGAVSPDRICAVRVGDRIVLSRVRLKDQALLLLPGEGEDTFDTVPVPDAQSLQATIAGTHVLLLRR